MSVEVGTAYVSIVPSARGFAGRLQSEIGGGMSAAGRSGGDQYASGMGASIKSKARAIFLPLMAGVGVLGGLGAAGAALGIKTAAANEQAEISFTTMLGSAEKAQSFLAQMQQFAAKTPFEFPELQTAASSLISAGINADKVIPIMKTLGDVTSGMGTGSEGVQRATVALQQMSAAGRITGEDLNQLRDAGIPVYDLLAKATGKSKAEIVKLAAAGKLGSKELGQMMKALETGAGLERFSGLMDKQSASLTGMWSTFKDTLGQGLANAIQPVLPLLKDGLGAASERLATILPKVGAALKTAVEFGVQFARDFQNGEGAAGRFRDTLTTVRDVLVTVTGFLRDNATAVQIVGGALLSGLVAFKAITTAVKVYTGVQAALNVVMSMNPIGLVIVAIAALVGGLVVAYKKSETFRDIVNRAFDLVKVGALQLATAAIGAFRHLVNFYLTMVSTLVTGAAKAFGWVPGLGPKLRTAAGNVATFKDNANAALDKVQKDLEIKANTAKAEAAINELRRQAGKPITVEVFMKTNYTAGRVNVAGVGVVNAGQRAHGGPVAKGQPYLVGERRPEMFVPSEHGRIEPRVAGGSGVTRLHPDDIDALAGAMLAGAGAVSRGVMSGTARAVAAGRGTR